MKEIDFKKELNKEQYEVVTAGDGPHLVLAGAGSGKTRALTYRAAWLLSRGIEPDKILLLTFTNKAANEMMNRVKGILGLKANAKLPLWGGTFHSVANRLLRIYGKHIDLESDFTIMDEDDKKSLLKNIIDGFFSSISAKQRPSAAIVGETISFATNSSIDISESLEIKFPEWEPFLEYFEKIATEYKDRKRKAKLLDFDDLLFYWLKLTLDPNISKMLAKKWQYILVDEYQDTNSLQANIIYNLAKEHKNILVVGDDAQSIYSFRAANIQNILDFPKVFKNTKIHKLETNYRSTPEILDLANEVIAGNQNQFPKNLSATLEGFVRPELVAVRNNLQEAEYIVNRIKEFLENGLDPREVVVLFRAAHHSQNLEMELNRHGIAYEMRGGLKFFERAHVKDVVAWLRILNNHKDEVSWLRVLQIYPGVGPKAALKVYSLVSQAEDFSDIPNLGVQLSAKAMDSWKTCVKLIQKLSKEKKADIGKLINIIVQDYGFYLTEKYPDYKQRLDDLDQLSVFAGGYKDLDTFLSEVSLQESFVPNQDRQKNDDAIILSTIHQAKGLEWSSVFVMNLTNQSFPHPLAKTSEEREEERRLFYVAVTRAKRNLHLIYPMSEYRYDGHRNLLPSEFVTDVNSDLFQHNELSRNVTYASSEGTEYLLDPDFADHKDNDDGDGFLPDVGDW